MYSVRTPPSKLNMYVCVPFASFFVDPQLDSYSLRDTSHISIVLRKEIRVQMSTSASITTLVPIHLPKIEKTDVAHIHIWVGCNFMQPWSAVDCGEAAYSTEWPTPN